MDQGQRGVAAQGISKGWHGIAWQRAISERMVSKPGDAAQ